MSWRFFRASKVFAKSFIKEMKETRWSGPPPPPTAEERDWMELLKEEQRLHPRPKMIFLPWPLWLAMVGVRFVMRLLADSLAGLANAIETARRRAKPIVLHPEIETGTPIAAQIIETLKKEPDKKHLWDGPSLIRAIDENKGG